MIISDLNYLESVDEEIFGGGQVFFDTDVDKDVDIDVDVDVDIDKDVFSDVNIDDNLGTAEASADAIGNNTLAETETFAQATVNFSEAFSQSTAAVD